MTNCPLLVTAGPDLYPLNHIFPTWGLPWAGLPLVSALYHRFPHRPIHVMCPDSLQWWCQEQFPFLKMTPAPSDAFPISGAACPTLAWLDELARHPTSPHWVLTQPAHAIRDWVHALSLLETMAHHAGFLPRQGDDRVAVMGGHVVWCHPTVTIDPWVVLDARLGPIILHEGVAIRSHTRVEGPVVMGEHSQLLNGQLRHACIGPQCKVGGEVSHSIMVGWSNKAHDGFMGHSVVGQWVNIGAGSVTSNLKHTYGPIHMAGADRPIETGMMFLGSMIGDFVKLGIGTQLTTGGVIGTGAALASGIVAPSYVPPFCWMSPDTPLDWAAFTTSLTRMMARRSQVPHPALIDRIREQWPWN